MAVQTVTVTCALDSAGKPTGIDNVFTLQLNIGDSATWQIFNLPADFTLVFNFASPNAPNGLFENSPAIQTVVGDGSEANFILPAFFQPDPNELDYSYNISVKDPSGTILISHDPQIDSLGPPGPVDDGGGS